MTRVGFHAILPKHRNVGFVGIYWQNHNLIERELPEDERPHKVWKKCLECGRDFYVYRLLNQFKWSKVKHCGPECYGKFKSNINRNNSKGGKKDLECYRFTGKCSECGTSIPISVRHLAQVKTATPKHKVACTNCGHEMNYKDLTL